MENEFNNLAEIALLIENQTFDERIKFSNWIYNCFEVYLDDESQKEFSVNDFANVLSIYANEYSYDLENEA